jgi:hypothetical protein
MSHTDSTEYDVFIRRHGKYSSLGDQIKAFVVGKQHIVDGEVFTDVFAEFPVAHSARGTVNIMSEKLARKYAMTVCESLNATVRKIDQIEVTIG